MDPPPLPPLPTTITPTSTTTAAATATATATTTATSIQLNYPDSLESSPRSLTADHLDDLPPVPGSKLRLMCSYGGHIVPRPHDKSLCYIGGDTRLVVVDRHSSLPSLCSRLSRTLINGRPFTLKYQLPREELDSLVSITTDEDLENMIEEYDRISTSASSLNSSRIRLFLFFTKPETSASMGSLLDDAKSETWFVDALNGSGLLPRNLSDSATMDCLVNLDKDNDLEAQTEGENKQVKNAVHDVQYSMTDSTTVENGSSFGSSSSPPSMSNLPPIRVRVEDQKVVGMEEQFAQMSFAQAVQKQQDDGLGHLPAGAAVPPLPMTVAVSDSVTVASGVSAYAAGVCRENVNRVFSDDERLDQGVPVGFRKPPLPLQPVQHKAGACYNLPSPDSVASDSSIASASSFLKPIHYQDQVHVASRENRGSASPNTIGENSIPTSQIQVQESGYVLPSQLDQSQQQQQQQQQQFIHASMHYIPHPATSPVPMSSYYPMYAPPPSQQQLHHPIDQHYPMYVMPITQTQEYNMPVQSNLADTTKVVASNRPLTPPNPHIVAATAAYKDTHPPIYPTKTAAPANPEMAAGLYRTAVTSTPQMIQVPSSQFQQQYVGFSQVHHPSQSIAVASATSANYGYEYANPAHDQVYYTQHQAAPLPPQYQTMTPAAAAVALADAAKQLPTDNTMH